MKSICLGIIGHVWTCFEVRSLAFVGTFRNVNVSLFCGASRDFFIQRDSRVNSWGVGMQSLVV